MNNKIRVLVVGLGSIGQRHARLLSERAELDIYLCDSNVELQQQAIKNLLKKPAACYSSYASALKEGQPDIVFISVPNHLHVPMALDAMNNGADVFIEKPVSGSLEEARSLLIIVDNLNRFAQIGYMLRFDEGLIKLKQIIENGDIGNIVAGRAMIGTYVTLLNAKGTERVDHPNTLVADYTHELDFIRWFFGDVSQVTAMSARLGNMELKPHPNIFQIAMKFTSGAIVQVHMDYIQYPQRRIFEIYGDRGTLSYDFMTGEIRQFYFQRGHSWVNKDVGPVTDRWDDLFRNEHESLFTARLNGEPPLVSVLDGIRALEIAEMAIASSES